MKAYTPDELGDWVISYYLNLKDIWGPAYSPDRAWGAKSNIEDFIYYLKRDAQ